MTPSWWANSHTRPKLTHPISGTPNAHRATSTAATLRPRATGTAAPHRPWAPTMAGARATTPMYTARNHSGWASDPARTAAGSTPSRRSTATNAVHTRAKASTGRTSRVSRPRSQSP